MKRSEINQRIREAILFFDKQNFKLPRFAFWDKEKWLSCNREEYREIKDAMLGWDITDFGSGNFSATGLLLFTLRNGIPSDSKKFKTYAEKIMMVGEEQLTPYHFHWSKTEDIVNRGGGNLSIQLYNSTEDGKMVDTPVSIGSDGRNYLAGPGTVLRLEPGDSVTLKPGQYHRFWGEKGCGAVLVGEVSKPNNDKTDNRFYHALGRFPKIEEDEEPLYLLFHEVPL